MPGVRNASKAVFLFPSKVIRSTINAIGGLFSFIHNLNNVNEENKSLKEQLDELRAQNSLYMAKIHEMERLKKYEPLSSRFLFSNVIARDPGNWFKTVFIDKGRDDGVEVNMVALLPGGVVGRIIEVAPKYSSVLLAVDRGSKIAAIVKETRELGFVEGMEEYLSMSFFSRDIQAKPGDTVLTSGLGGTFPKGLAIGKITQVKKGGLIARASIEPEVNFNTLEEVLVLLK